MRSSPICTLGTPHRDLIIGHLLALDSDARVLRFGCRVSDDRVRQYVGELDFGRDAIFGVADRPRSLGALVHLAFPPSTDTPGGVVEFGVSVLLALRGQGLGSRLFEHAVVHARNRGMKRMVIHMARDNAAMRAIVRSAGAAMAFDGPDVIAELPLPADTLGSQMQEWFGHQTVLLRGPANGWPAFERPAFGHSVR